MNASLFLALASTVCAPGIKEKQAKPTIVGEWEVVASTQRVISIGTKIEYTKDGKFKIAIKQPPGAQVSFEYSGEYELEKDRLRSWIVACGRKGQEDLETIDSLTADALVLTSQLMNTKLELKRIKK